MERREAQRARSRRFAQADRPVARAAPEARASGNIRPRGAATTLAPPGAASSRLGEIVRESLQQNSDAKSRRENEIACPPLPARGCARRRGPLTPTLSPHAGRGSEDAPRELFLASLCDNRMERKTALTQSQRTCRTRKAPHAARGSCWPHAHDRRSRWRPRRTASAPPACRRTGAPRRAGAPRISCGQVSSP